MSYESCCELIRFLNVRQGDKVLHLGCGSGDIAKFIAGLVGSHGEVVAVDREHDNINQAEEQYKEVKNLRFYIGDSATGFPHENEHYYDLIFSCDAFQELQGLQKKGFVDKAYQSLTKGGRLAVVAAQTEDPEAEDTNNTDYSNELSQSQLDGAVQMLRNKPGEKVFSVSHFSSFEEFDRPISKLLRTKPSRFGAEFQGWMTEFQEKCKETEKNGKLRLEFKELVRVKEKH